MEKSGITINIRTYLVRTDDSSSSGESETESHNDSVFLQKKKNIFSIFRKIINFC